MFKKIFFFTFFCFSIHSSQNMGVGYQSSAGAYRANGFANDIMFYNPAGLLKEKKYEFDIEYFFGLDKKTNGFSVALADSRTTFWSLGLAYSSMPSLGFHQTYLAFAFPLVKKILSFGASGHYKRAVEKNFFNTDFGLLLNSHVGPCLALTLNDLFPTTMDKTKGALAVSYDFGAVINIIPLTISLDWIMNDLFGDGSLDHELNGSMHYLLFDLFALRAGLNNKIYLNENSISLGAGVNAKVIGIDAFYKQNLSVGKLKEFGLSARLMF